MLVAILLPRRREQMDYAMFYTLTRLAGYGPLAKFSETAFRVSASISGASSVVIIGCALYTTRLHNMSGRNSSYPQDEVCEGEGHMWIQIKAPGALSVQCASQLPNDSTRSGLVWSLKDRLSGSRDGMFVKADFRANAATA